MQDAHMQIVSAQYLQEETTRVSSFALYRTRVDQNFDDAGNKLGAGAATGSPFRLSAIDPSETVQAVGDTPETHRTNASRGSEANGYDRFLFLNTMFRWASQSDNVREWGPPSPNLPKLRLGRTSPVAADFHTNRAPWARGVVGRVSFSTRAAGQLPSR